MLSICSLRILKPIYKLIKKITKGCDLLSICSLRILKPILSNDVKANAELWFAFNMFFEDIKTNDKGEKLLKKEVVICFQYVLWGY